jgi:hypothetical protein
MRAELQEKLQRRFPKIYGGKPFECGDGWYSILEELGLELEGTKKPITILQIKEKFGTLRVYLDPSDPAVQSAVDYAEEQSARVCEKCSKPGSLCRSPYGWFRTLCVECAAKIGRS